MKKRAVVKNALRIVLLLFVAGSVGYLFAKEYVWNGGETPAPAAAPSAAAVDMTPATPDHVVAYYFHGNFRCASCRKIEEYSRAAIEEGFPAELKDGRLSFEVVNVEEPPNRHFVRDYALVTKSLVLVLKDGDRQVRFKNLDLVWQLLGSRDEFRAYVQKEVRGFLGEVRR
jgi:hypothetical protein